MKMLQDIHNDITLLRFLRARNYEIKAALKMFMDAVEWREKEKVDKTVEEFAFRGILY